MSQLGEAKGKNMQGLLAILVLSIVGLALSPAIQAQVTTILATGSSGDLNMTGSARAIIGLFPMFWVILMIAIPVAYIAVWLK